MNRITITILATGALALPALAQIQPAKGPAGSTAPVAITPDKTIPLAQALAAAQAALDACLALPKPSPAVVLVADLNGNTKVELAADGVGLPFFDFARRKAYTTLKKGMASGAFGKTLGTVPRGTVIEGDPNLINWAGALPITKGGQTVGAIAVSGPTGQDDDETCARAGLAKIRL